MPQKRKSLEELTPIVNGNDAVWNHPLIKILDPTGITSYPEVIEVEKNIQNVNPVKRCLTWLSAVPAIGRVGKILNSVGNLGGLVDDIEKYYKTDSHNYDAIYYSPNIKNGKSVGYLGPRRSLSRDAILYPATKQEIQYYIDNTEKDTDVLNYIRTNKR